MILFRNRISDVWSDVQQLMNWIKVATKTNFWEGKIYFQNKDFSEADRKRITNIIVDQTQWNKKKKLYARNCVAYKLIN